MALQQIRLPSFNSDNEYRISVCASTSCRCLENKLMLYTRLPHQVTLTLGVRVSFQSPQLKTKTINGYLTRKAFFVPSGEIFSNKCQEIVKKKIDLMEIPFPLDKNVEWKSLYRSQNGMDWNQKSLANEADIVTEITKYAHSIRDCPPLYLESLEINLEIKKTITLPHQEFVALSSAAEELSRTDVDFSRFYHELIRGGPERRLEKRIRALESLKEGRFKDVSDSDSPSMGFCSVCWEKFTVGSKVVKTPCSHVYHESCLVKWLKVNMSCPYCRSGLPG